MTSQTFEQRDIVYTKPWVAADMVATFNPSGKILEPCYGGGAIFNEFPKDQELIWCEIEKGRDFFTFYEPVDWIITNPPYSILTKFLDHSLKIANNVVFLIPLHNFFGSGKQMDLAYKHGWMKHIRWMGSGRSVGFGMGNPMGAVHFQKDYWGPTSWSKYKGTK